MSAYSDPYRHISGIKYETVATTHEMNKSAAKAIETNMHYIKASGTNTAFPIYLIAQTSSGIEEVEEWVERRNAYGVAVKSYTNMISDLWGVFGDGRPIVGMHAIREITRTAYTIATGKTPTQEALSLATNAVDASLAINDALLKDIAKTSNDGEGISARMLLEANRLIDKRGMVHPNYAAFVIASEISTLHIPITMIFEDPSENNIPQIEFVKKISDAANITVIRRDAESISLDNEISAVPTLFADARGYHVYEQAVIAAVKNISNKAPDYNNVTLVMSENGVHRERILEALANEHIPFESRVSYTLSETPFGKWLIDVITLWENCEKSVPDNDLEAALIRLSSSAYTNGLEEDILRSILIANSSEISDSNAISKEKGTLATLLAHKELIPLMRYITSNEGHPAPGSEWHSDDLVIAQVAGDFYKHCSNENVSIIIDDFANVTVALPRSYGEIENCISVLERSEASYDNRPYIIVTGMEAASSRGYVPAGTFSAIADRLGVSSEPWQQARLLRFQILDMIRHAQNGAIAFVRSCNDATGAESPPSPLLLELQSSLNKFNNEYWVISEAEELAAQMANAKNLNRQKWTQANGIQVDPMTTFIKPTKNGNPHVFSPTELELYWNCPRKWFLSRNGAGYDEPIQASLDDARTRGNIVHDTLDTYYKEFGKDHYRVDIEHDPNALAAFEDAFESATQKHLMLATEDKETKTVKQTLSAMKKSAINVVIRDMSFLPGFSPCWFEEYIDGTIGDMFLHGRMDRIDIADEFNDDGTRNVVIIDYKGAPGSDYRWDKKKNMPGLKIQGYIYATMFEDKHPDLKVAGVIYRGYSNGEDVGEACVPLENQKKATMSEKNFREAIENARSQIAAEISGLLKGDYPIKPRNVSPNACRYCPIALSCPGKAAM